MPREPDSSGGMAANVAAALRAPAIDIVAFLSLSLRKATIGPAPEDEQLARRVARLVAGRGQRIASARGAMPERRAEGPVP